MGPSRRSEDPRPIIALAAAIIALCRWHLISPLHLDLHLHPPSARLGSLAPIALGATAIASAPATQRSLANRRTLASRRAVVGGRGFAGAYRQPARAAAAAPESSRHRGGRGRGSAPGVSDRAVERLRFDLAEVAARLGSSEDERRPAASVAEARSDSLSRSSGAMVAGQGRKTVGAAQQRPPTRRRQTGAVVEASSPREVPDCLPPVARRKAAMTSRAVEGPSAEGIAERAN